MGSEEGVRGKAVDRLWIEKGARSLGIGVQDAVLLLRVPRALWLDKVAWTNDVRACHVSKLLALTTSFQGIQ